MDNQQEQPTETNPENTESIENLPSDKPPESDKPKRNKLGLPAWTLVLLILALTGVLIWAGDALLRSRQRVPDEKPTVQPTTTPTRKPAVPTSTRSAPSTPLPTPTALPELPTPSASEKPAILVAEFAQESDDVAQSLYEALLAGADAADLKDWTRIERFPQVVTDDTADSAFQDQNAAYVLWGLGDSEGATAYLRYVKPTAPISLTAQARKLAQSEPVETKLCALGNPDLVTSFVLGVTAYRQGETAQASSLLDAALATGQRETQCGPLLAHAYLYLGNLAGLAGEYEAALADYAAGLALAATEKDRALFYTNQASIHYQQQDYQAALSATNQALEQAPDLANAYYHRANTYRALKQLENAQADLDRALALDPTHARAYASRGLMRHNANAFKEALQDYNRSLELDPWAAEVYLNRGGTYATQGDMDAALEDYSQALTLQPEDADAYYNRGTVYAIQERYAEALQDLNRALEIDPEFAQVYGNRGLIYKALGDREAAIADLEKFLELAGNSQWREMIEQHLAELLQAQE